MGQTRGDTQAAAQKVEAARPAQMPYADPRATWRGPGRRCGANKRTAGEWSTPAIAIALHTRPVGTAGFDDPAPGRGAIH